jgi:hypothetical protein
MKDNSKFIAALEYLKEECMAGRGVSAATLAKKFKISNRFLAAVVELGYIRVKPGHSIKYYNWVVGDIIPVMGKAVKDLCGKKNMEAISKSKSKSVNDIGIHDKYTPEPCDTKVDLQQALKDHERTRLRRVIDELTAKLKDQKERYDQEVKTLSEANLYLASQVDALQQAQIVKCPEQKSVWSFEIFGITIFKKRYVKSN